MIAPLMPPVPRSPVVASQYGRLPVERSYFQPKTLP
jgi:hypothetical protein